MGALELERRGWPEVAADRDDDRRPSATENEGANRRYDRLYR